MSKKVFSLEQIGEVAIYKRRGIKKVSLRLAGDSIRVSQPTWLPYSAGIAFARQNAGWIANQRTSLTKRSISSGQFIGKNHTINFIAGPKVRSLVKNSQIDIYYTHDKTASSAEVQNIAKKAIKRALILEAKELIPARLELMAQNFDYNYNGLKVKSLKSRWGSCNSTKQITINCYLMMMPWEIIDYVLLHELTHTEHLHHGKDFWTAMDNFMPDYKRRRKMLKELQPSVASIQI